MVTFSRNLIVDVLARIADVGEQPKGKQPGVSDQTSFHKSKNPPISHPRMRSFGRKTTARLSEPENCDGKDGADVPKRNTTNQLPPLQVEAHLHLESWFHFADEIDVVGRVERLPQFSDQWNATKIDILRKIQDFVTGSYLQIIYKFIFTQTKRDG